MSRRVSLPGADELFRTTGGMALQASSPRKQGNPVAGGGEPRVPAQGEQPDEAPAPQPSSSEEHSAADADPPAPSVEETGPVFLDEEP
ncbi:hypothetical protein ABT276_34245, partial [Streptomyces xantholiticus]